MHMTLGTSPAVGAPPPRRSFSPHPALGTPDIAVVKRFGLYVMGGVIIGILSARYSSSTTLKWVWVVFGSLMASKMALVRDDWRLGDDLPNSWLAELYMLCVGIVSVL